MRQKKTRQKKTPQRHTDEMKTQTHQTGVLVDEHCDLRSWFLPGWIHGEIRRVFPWTPCECWKGRPRNGTPWCGSALCRLCRGPAEEINSYFVYSDSVTVAATVWEQNMLNISHAPTNMTLSLVFCTIRRPETRIKQHICCTVYKYLHGFVQAVCKVRGLVLYTANCKAKRDKERAEEGT